MIPNLILLKKIIRVNFFCFAWPVELIYLRRNRWIIIQCSTVAAGLSIVCCYKITTAQNRPEAQQSYCISLIATIASYYFWMRGQIMKNRSIWQSWTWLVASSWAIHNLSSWGCLAFVTPPRRCPGGSPGFGLEANHCHHQATSSTVENASSYEDVRNTKEVSFKFFTMENGMCPYAGAYTTHAIMLSKRGAKISSILYKKLLIVNRSWYFLLSPFLLLRSSDLDRVAGTWFALWNHWRESHEKGRVVSTRKHLLWLVPWNIPTAYIFYDVMCCYILLSHHIWLLQ